MILILLTLASAATMSEFTLISPYETINKKLGFLTSKKRIPINSWELEVKMVMNSSDVNKLHGEGMAIWITDSQIKSGSAFGAANKWKGLALIFDTFKNADKDIPSAQIIMNYNNKVYNGENDGIDIVSKSCFLGNLRSTPFTAYLKYQHDVRELSLDIQQEGKERVPCFKNAVYKVNLGQYLSVSAQTGEVSDAHQLLELKVNDISEKLPKKKKYTPHEPVTEEISFDALALQFTSEELLNTCNTEEEGTEAHQKCVLGNLYTTLGEVSNEISLNLKLAKQKKETINHIYRSLEQVAESVTIPSSAAVILKQIHDLQDHQAEELSNTFTSTADLMERYKEIISAFSDTNTTPKQPETIFKQHQQKKTRVM
ncbi:Vesicular mannose-binding lectin [Entamoeba marina]